MCGEVRALVIYADVLVCLNVLITYLFLVADRVFTHLPTSRWGVIVASVVGGLSALVVLLGDKGVLFSILFRVVASCLIVLAAFLPRSTRCFLKAYGGFMAISFLFGGAMFFVELTLRPEKIAYINGTVYFDMSLRYLVCCTFVIYGVFMAADYFLSRNIARNEIFGVEITLRNATVILRGFVDTGNNLTEALTGRMVFVAQLNSVAPLFTCEECTFLKRAELSAVPESLGTVIRYIPCKTVGENALLPAFTPKRVIVKWNGKETEVNNVCIAVTDKALSQGEYEILLNKNILG